MTDRIPKQHIAPAISHPARDWLSLELLLPAQTALVERMLDRIERGADG